MHDEVKQTGTNETGDLLSIENIVSLDPLKETDIAVSGKDIENLRRWGFQYAIKNKQADKPQPDEVLDLYKKQLLDELNRWEVVYDGMLKRYDEKIEGLRKEKTQLSTAAASADPTLDDLKQQREKLLEEMKEMREKILAVRRKMLTGKEDMMNKWMAEAEKQVEMAVALQKKVYKEIKEINKQRYDDEKDTLDIHIDQWKKRRYQFQQRQDEVNKKMKRVGADGVNPSAAYLLIGIGTSAAAAAGYFFSVFTGTANFGNQDALYFLISGFLKAGASPQSGFFMKIVFLLVFVLVVGIISYLCYLVFEHFFGKKKRSEDSLRLSAGGKILKDQYDTSGEIKAGSWFSFWLQVAPAIITIGLVLLILAITQTGADINRVNSSVEGMLTGTAVALAIGGVMCLYIMKIIEPRLMRREEDEKGLYNWLKCNWELAVCILLFAAITLSIIFYPLTTGKLESQHAGAIAVLEFIAVAFLSAFCFAYGIRFRGLIAVNRFLQQQINHLDYIIAESATPEIPDVSVDYAFAMKGLVEDVLAVVQNKALLLRGITSKEDLKPVKTKDESRGALIKRIAAYFFRKRKDDLDNNQNSPLISQLTRLAEWESRYFPDIDEEMKLLAYEYRELEGKVKDINNQLDKLEATATGEKDERSESEKKIQQQIETLLTYKEKVETVKVVKAVKIELFSIEAEAAILDGYHLGIWYRENKMGPSDDYYISAPLISPADSPDDNTTNGVTVKLHEDGNN